MVISYLVGFLAYLAKMRFRFMEDRRADYPVRILCDMLGVSRRTAVRGVSLNLSGR
jgi:hypothetical protein